MGWGPGIAWRKKKKQHNIQLVGTGTRSLSANEPEAALPPRHRRRRLGHRFDSRALQESIKCISHTLRVVVRVLRAAAPDFHCPAPRGGLTAAANPARRRPRPAPTAACRGDGGKEALTSRQRVMRPAGRYVRCAIYIA